MTKKTIKKPTIMRNIEPQVEPQTVDFVQEVDTTEPQTEVIATETPTEKERPKAKYWVAQPDLVIDLHPSVSSNIAELDAEIETYRKAIEQNQYARKRAIRGVVKAFDVTPKHPSLEGIRFVKSNEGVYQLLIPQLDKQIEK